VAVGPRYISRAPVNNFNKERYLVASINDFLVYPGRPLDVTGRVKFLF
jgi:hypothetical protein